MNPDIRSIELFFPVEGISVNSRDLIKQEFESGTDYLQSVRRILKWWYETDLPLEIQTSGSTGNPKKLSFSREQVISSASLTIDSLKLESSSRALLAIDPDFIGGRMMIVRSLVAGMDLICIPPMANPLLVEISCQVNFASFVPYQVRSIMSDKLTFERFKKIDQVLIGGASVGADLWNQITELNNRVYSTYGMTETLSHIALLENIPCENHYTALNGVKLAVDHRSCLNIYAPHIQKQIIQTNDVVELLSTSAFRWVGRVDNIINSGGLKINPENVEELLRDAMERLDIRNEFIVSGVPDPALGTKLVLITAGKNSEPPDIEKKISTLIESISNKYHRPKQIFFVDQLIKNAGGKIDRAATLKLISNIFND